MAIARLNLPSVFFYGGAALPGVWRGGEVAIVDVYEGVGKVYAGEIDASELDALERVGIGSLGDGGLPSRQANSVSKAEQITKDE